MSFSELGLNQALLSTIARQGYSVPTPIQQRAIPVVLSGRDLLAAAQTGTGKTAAFTLPILERLSRADNGKHHNAPRVLVLTPTRELAAQVGESVRTYRGDMRLNSTVIFGGVSPVPQLKALRRGVDVLIATPGRLLDHAQQGNVDLSGVEVFVLDEADRMLDMGFIHDIRKIVDRLPARRQNLMFSATFSKEIRQMAQRYLHNPEQIEVAPRNATADLVEQKMVYVAKHQKRELLSWMIGANNWRQVLVFTRTKHGANRLCEQLGKDGLPSAALHGNKSQGARTRALQEFKSGKVRVLVATDIAARGLDIDQLPHVINYELPNVPEDYVHRIGRTGRAGESGEALSLVSRDERDYLRDICKLLGRQIPEMPLEGFALDQEKPADGKSRQQAGANGRPPGKRPSSGKHQRAGGAKSGYAHKGDRRERRPGKKRRAPAAA